MEERSEKCMRRENEHEKKQNGYWKKFLKQKYHFKILPWILILSPKLISLFTAKEYLD